MSPDATCSLLHQSSRPEARSFRPFFPSGPLSFLILLMPILLVCAVTMLPAARAFASDHLIFVGFEEHWAQRGPASSVEDLVPDPNGDDYWIASYMPLSDGADADFTVIDFYPFSGGDPVFVVFDEEDEGAGYGYWGSGRIRESDRDFGGTPPALFKVFQHGAGEIGSASWTGGLPAEPEPPAANPLFTGPAGRSWWMDEGTENARLVVNLHGGEPLLSWNSDEFTNFTNNGGDSYDTILFVLLDITGGGEGTEVFRREQETAEFTGVNLSNLDDGEVLTYAVEAGKTYFAMVDFTVARILETPATGTGVLDGALQGYAIGHNTITIIDIINDAGFAGGSGAEDDPWQIATAEQLDRVRNHLDGHFILLNDIDLDPAENAFINAAFGWEAIGTLWGGSFTGSFDGDGRVISNLFINRPTEDYQGLFGYTEGAAISNLGLTNVVITGNSDTGGLVGRSARRESGVSPNMEITPTTINTCFVTGTVHGSGSVGGLVGTNSGSVIADSFSSAAVTGSFQNVGGLVGWSTLSSSISASFATGNVNGGGQYVGGLVGNLDNSNITDCYARGNATGTGTSPASEHVGGLVGGTSGSTIENSYSTGVATGSGNVGGLVGSIGTSSATASFWDRETSEKSTSAGGTGRTTAEMTLYGTFFNAGWDFIGERVNGARNIWGINEAGADNDGYPFLAWQEMTHKLEFPVPEEPQAGAGTIDSPYEIATVNNLFWIAQDTGRWDKYYKQTSDIDLSSSAFMTGGTGWMPLGNARYPFTGTYDGNNKTISNLSINRSDAEGSQGLFGSLYGAIVANLLLLNVDVTGRSSVGGLAGYMRDSAVSGCQVTGVVTGNVQVGGLAGYLYQSTVSESHAAVAVNGSGDNTQKVGGLAGNVSNSNILTCSATGNVRSLYSVGGLAGDAMYSTIEESYATGAVTGESSVGGLLGYSYDVTVSDCYASGFVTGSAAVGGLVGHNHWSSDVNNSYSTGLVRGAADTGGLVGKRYDDTSVVNNSFWNSETSGQATSQGGVGTTTADMKTLATFTDAGWDFVGEAVNGTDNIWNMDGRFNNGYPSLAWQAIPATPVVATHPPGDVTATTATGKGAVTGLGTTDTWEHGVWEHGFCWNMTGNPTIDRDSITTEGARSATGVFTSAITGLSADTTYYLRAYATNDAGTAYGNEVSFTTPPVDPAAPTVGDGSEGTPYEIATLNNLLWIIQNDERLGKHYLQTADIDATATATWNGGDGWTPIGNNVTPFSGAYDGNGHTIDGLLINRGTEDNMGFFGYVSGASITGLGITNGDITGKGGVGGLAGQVLSSTVSESFAAGAVRGYGYNVGGLAGYLYQSTVSGSHAAGVVTGSETYVGGLVGHSKTSTITGCHAATAVGGSDSVGGLVGRNAHSAAIIDSFATGSVAGDQSVGGLVGYHEEGTTISGSYATGSVRGKNSVGGLVGIMYKLGGNSPSVTDSYATGSVAGDQYVGGLVGYCIRSVVTRGYATGAVTGSADTGGLVGKQENSNVADSFWDTETSGQATSQGGSGTTTADMKTQATYTDAGWDFVGESVNGTDNIWNMAERFNGGYPSLAWQVIPATPVVATHPPGDITVTTAAGKGALTGMGTTDTWEHGFCWNMTGNPTIDRDSITTEGARPATGVFTSAITGLSADTTYYLRAYATNDAGTAYGNEVSFTTPPVDPVAPADGDGSEGTPYQLATLNNLVWMAGNSERFDKHYVQTADIDASATATWNGGAGWTPPGTMENYFTGSYDGGGFTISGLVIRRGSEDRVGFFGYTYGAAISNLELANVDITGHTGVGGLLGAGYDTTLNGCSLSGNVTGVTAVGGLAGQVGYSLIMNSHAAAEVTGSGNRVGGLVGFVEGATISDSYATGNVTGALYVGGLVGDHGSSAETVSGCYATGAVTGAAFAGGLVGRNTASSAVSDSYARGSVTGSSYLGGLVGENSEDSTITHCYATGTVAGDYRAGGLAGYTAVDSSVEHCFWDTDRSEQEESSGGTGATTAQMKSFMTFLSAGWDFIGQGDVQTWGIDESGEDNDGYPFLAWQGMTHRVYPPEVTTQAASAVTGSAAALHGTILAFGSGDPTEHGFCWNETGNPTIDGDDAKTEKGAPSSTGPFTSDITGLSLNTTYSVRAYATNIVGTAYGEEVTFSTLPVNPTPPEGSGTAETPYEIATVNNLFWIAQDTARWNRHYVQTADVDASGTQTWYGGAGWIPLGNSSVKFTGSYDGGGFTISGLTINRSATDYAGLFGYVEEASLSNIRLSDVSVTASWYTGGLVGYAQGASLSNIRLSDVTVTAGRHTGGLVGYASITSLINCSSTGDVSSNRSRVGGLVGSLVYSGSTINGCLATGTVHGGEGWTGGLVGYMNDGSVNNSYAAGVVSGHQYIGGLVGYFSSGSISYSYALGTVVDTSGVARGGLVGGNWGTCDITTTFWNKETSGLANGAGAGNTAGTGKTTEEMKTSAAFILAGWDFIGEDLNGTAHIWGIDESTPEPDNGGYPFLAWQNLTHRARPVAATEAANAVTRTAATLHGVILAWGSAGISEHGFCWNRTGAPNFDDDACTTEGTREEGGSFSSTLDDLVPGTTYYARAYAVSDEGTAYGNIVEWTTDPALKGDLNDDGVVDLADLIIALQVVTTIDPGEVFIYSAVSGDGKIGLADALYILQKTGELR